MDLCELNVGLVYRIQDSQVYIERPCFNQSIIRESLIIFSISINIAQTPDNFHYIAFIL